MCVCVCACICVCVCAVALLSPISPTPSPRRSPLMVVEVSKPQHDSLAQLNVQLQSEVPASLTSLTVSVLAVRGSGRSTEGEEGIDQEERGSGGETVGVLREGGTGGVAFPRQTLLPWMTCAGVPIPCVCVVRSSAETA